MHELGNEIVTKIFKIHYTRIGIEIETPILYNDGTHVRVCVSEINDGLFSVNDDGAVGEMTCVTNPHNFPRVYDICTREDLPKTVIKIANQAADVVRSKQNIL